MNGTIILVIVIIALGVGGYFIYQYVEKPLQEEANIRVNLSIIATNEEGEIIHTGYRIFLDGVEVKTDNTLSRGFVLDKVFLNKSVEVRNFNINGQNYYTSSIKFDTFEGNLVKRIDLKLIAPGTVKINQSRLVTKSNSNVKVSIYPDGIYRNLAFCISWSTNFIFVKNDKFKKIDRPKRFSKYDKCFYLGILELDKGLYAVVDLEYGVFGDLRNNNYLKIVVYDGEKIGGVLNFSEEIGAKDVFYNFTLG